MKVTLFNDTRKDWRLHIGSLRGRNDESRVPAQQSLDFELADGEDVFVKVWETGVVLVRPFRSEPAQPQLPLSDAERMNIEAHANLIGVLNDFGRGQE